MNDQEAYHELCAYTLTKGDPAFLHQHVGDAFAAQTADEKTKPITVTFALVGLYLHLEEQFSGRQVQRAHQYLARRARAWPSLPLPKRRGALTAADVLRTEGAGRDAAIHRWCTAVWESFCQENGEAAQIVRGLCEELARFGPATANNCRSKENYGRAWP
ncbi:MAG: DUF5946 family protein [Chthoniobacterales bacterium]